jgi:8-oxo-dGTP diphosphatase
LSKVKQTVAVAVAVLHSQDRYLLGYRHKAQHQGERFEFVGGKIEATETAQDALVREVAEEIGLSLTLEQLTKLGRITHNYGDKAVCLHIYDVTMTLAQHEQFAEVTTGCEGQPLRWVEKSALLAGDFPMPAANLPILTWLTLPTVITITHELGFFQQENDPLQAWTDYHQQHLPLGSHVYIRPKAEHAITEGLEAIASLNNLSNLSKLEYQQQVCQLTLKAVLALLAARADIQVILPELGAVSNSVEIQPLLLALHEFISAQRVLAQHCTHKTLMQYAEGIAEEKGSQDRAKNEKVSALIESFLGNKLPILVSCHDLVSIAAANKLASYRIHHHQPVVLGGFLSPVAPTLTHPDSPNLGWEKFSELSDYMDFPTIALGGLTLLDAEPATRHGGVGIAGIRGFL